jgi:hypothetical protein
MAEPRDRIQLLLIKMQVTSTTTPLACPIGIYTNLFAGGAAEINRRRRRKQSEKTPSPDRGDGLNSIRRPCRGWEVGRTQFRWFHRRPSSAVPPGRELISQLA